MQLSKGIKMKLSVKLITILLSASLLAACNVINVLKLRSANDDVEPVWHSEQDTMRLKTAYDGEKAYVYGNVNGVNDFKFMIDTGASFTYLFDTEKVKALNLPKGDELDLGGWGDDENSLGYRTKMETFRFADMQVDSPQELTFDGVIGHDLLRHFSWTFDKKANQVSISNKAAHVTELAQAIPFDTFMSKISINAEIDFDHDQKVQYDIIIDTGSRHYFKLSAAYPESEQIKLPKAKVTAADFGLSGKAEHQRVTLPSLKLGQLKLNKIKTNLIENADEDDYWIIGNAALNQFVTVIDYHTDTLYLTPYPNHSFSSRYNLMGLEVRKQLSGDFVVRFVMPELPAKALGIKVGDILTKVNGTPIKDISKDEWLTLSATPGEYQLCFLNSDCKTLTTKHINGYSN